MKKNNNVLLASSMIFSMEASQASMIYAEDANDTGSQEPTTEEVKASSANAVAGIKMPMYDESGTKVDHGISDVLLSKLSVSDLVAKKDDANKTLTVDAQLKNVNLSSDYASWVATAVKYGIEEAPTGFTLIITEDDKVINGTDCYTEIMSNGLTDRGELNICSINFIKEDTATTEPETKTDTTTNDTDKISTNVKTGVQSNIVMMMGMLMASIVVAGAVFVIRKKHN